MRTLLALFFCLPSAAMSHLGHDGHGQPLFIGPAVTLSDLSPAPATPVATPPDTTLIWASIASIALIAALAYRYDRGRK
jgi:hypothetical protein